MSDYLKLAGACDIARIVLAVDGQNYKTAPYDTDVETILADTAAALRKAHALQEAYTNLGSERDLLLLECENLRGDLSFREEQLKAQVKHSARQQEEIERLRGAIQDVRHKGFCATVKYPCNGIEIEKGVYSGCSGGNDCPECNGVRPNCTCGIDKWKDTVLNNRKAPKESK